MPFQDFMMMELYLQILRVKPKMDVHWSKNWRKLDADFAVMSGFWKQFFNTPFVSDTLFYWIKTTNSEHKTTIEFSLNQAFDLLPY